jgi:hypothetical protein
MPWVKPGARRTFASLARIPGMWPAKCQVLAITILRCGSRMKTMGGLYESGEDPSRRLQLTLTLAI